MEICDLGKLPKAIGVVQHFNPPRSIPVNNQLLAWLFGFASLFTLLLGIGILYFTIVQYRKHHDLATLTPGLILGGFMLTFALFVGLTILADIITTRNTWLLRLDDQQAVIDCGPLPLAPQDRAWLVGSGRGAVIPYSEIESARTLTEHYHYPKTVDSQHSGDLATEIRTIDCPILELRLKNPAPPALRQALDDAARNAQELAARGSGKLTLDLTPLYVTLRLTDDKTIRLNWDPSLSPDLQQALAILGKHLAVRPAAENDVFPTTPFANTAEAWHGLDVPAINKYARFLFEQGYSNSAGVLLWELTKGDNVEDDLKRLVTIRAQTQGGSVLGDSIRQWLAAVKWAPHTLMFPLLGIFIFAVFHLPDYCDWKISNQTSGNWVETKGVIVTSLQAPKGEAPNIVYQFSAGGKEFQGRTITMSSYRGRHYRPDVLLSRYPVGREVALYYNPEQPEQSTLEYMKPQPLFGVILSALFTPMTALLLASLVGLYLAPFYLAF